MQHLTKFLKGVLRLNKISRKWSLYGSLSKIHRHASCSFQPCVFLKLLWQRPWRSSFLQKQALTTSLQNKCSKLQQTLPGKLASVFEKDFTIDVLLHKKLRKAKKITMPMSIPTSMPMLMSRCQSRDFQMANIIDKTSKPFPEQLFLNVFAVTSLMNF